jgi:uncharacterized protein (UPF0548 family)
MGARLERRYRAALAAEPTYPEVGATAGDRLPAGYHRVEDRIRLGAGPEVFERAGAAVLAWAAQRGAGLAVHPPDAGTEVGATALVLLPLPVLAVPLLVIPCRVVFRTVAADRIGFGYGTLPGHPERGEEAFLVERDADGTVWFRVRAFSRPDRWYSRLGGPATRLAQRAATRRYLRAVATAAR